MKKQYKEPNTKPFTISEEHARQELEGYYLDLDLAIEALNNGLTLQTNTAIYFVETS